MNEINRSYITKSVYPINVLNYVLGSTGGLNQLSGHM